MKCRERKKEADEQVKKVRAKVIIEISHLFNNNNNNNDDNNDNGEDNNNSYIGKGHNCSLHIMGNLNHHSPLLQI